MNSEACKREHNWLELDTIEQTYNREVNRTEGGKEWSYPEWEGVSVVIEEVSA